MLPTIGQYFHKNWNLFSIIYRKLLNKKKNDWNIGTLHMSKIKRLKASDYMKSPIIYLSDILFDTILTLRLSLFYFFM